MKNVQFVVICVEGNTPRNVVQVQSRYAVGIPANAVRIR